MNIILLILSLYLVYYDLKYKKVPNIINLILLIIVITYKIIIYGNIPRSYLVSGIIVFMIFTIIHLLTQGSIGMGDCKFTSIMALHFGYLTWAYSMILSSLIALIISGILIFIGKTNRKTRIPFIPFLVTGLIIVTV